MSRLTLALGYILTGDRRYLAEYNGSFSNSEYVYQMKQQRLLNQRNLTPVTDLELISPHNSTKEPE